MIDQQIDHWADDLIDLTGRNRLLYFRHTRSRSLEFCQEPEVVESRLDSGWRFYLPEEPAPESEPQSGVESPLEPPQDDQLRVSMQPERYKRDILRCLRNLSAQTQKLFLDRGLWFLHMGLGILRWTENGNADVQSPLFLIPVELGQTGTVWKLKRSDYSEPIFNPALRLRLKRDFEIELSLTPHDIDSETTFAEIRETTESAIRETAWSIESKAVLDLFMFHKMPMYDDLKRNREHVGRHPIVRLLAEGRSDTAPDLSFDPVPDENLDGRQPPEDLLCVLDADASQRQCIAAASDGRSFVLDGPPGTGKSQTIANIISQLLADGKSVLFVSEKAAALEVVHSRLAERNLDSFVLSLHSHMASRMAEKLGQLDECVRATCDELALPDEREPGLIPRLLAILELVEERHPIKPTWLSADPAAFTETTGKVDELVEALREQQVTEQQLRRLAPRWFDLSTSLTGKFGELEQRRGELTPSPTLSENTTAAFLREQRLLVGQVMEIVSGAIEHSDTLARLFGIEDSPTIGLLERLVGLGGLVGDPNPPEGSWLSAAGHSGAVRAHEALRLLLIEYKSRKSELADVFTEEVLELDLRRLKARFDSVHTGLRRLGPAYWEDRRQLAGAALTGRFTNPLLDFLPDAISWQEVHRKLVSAEAEHAEAIGDHYWPPGLKADLDRLGRAVEVAGNAVELAGADVALETLAALIARGTSPGPSAATTAAHGAAPLFEGRLLASLAETLAPAETELRALPLPSLADWLEGVASLLDESAELLDDVAEVTGSEHHSRLEPARQLAELRTARDTQGHAVSLIRQGVADALAGLADEDDPEVINKATAWAKAVRSHLEAVPPESATAEALLTTDREHAPLLSAQSAWEEVLGQLKAQFDTPRSEHLAADLSTSFDQALTLIERLKKTIDDVDEWEAFVKSQHELNKHGLGDIVQAATQRNLPGDQVEDVIERSVLQSWIDQVLQADHRLQIGGPLNHNAIVDEFRKLDRELVEDAAARVINSSTSRRPDRLIGPYQIINQQAQLQRRHMPVRRLLDEAGDAAKTLKPCFMMSPLSVSQFLPPTLTFDLVIFDEASQIREADAICCIYRGDQLIVAGDEKQLPPTNFFQRTTDLDDEITGDEEGALLDFDSVLDRCKAQGLRALGLRWHYRSKHESLIAFSNRKFYRGDLLTFPGAEFAAHHLGVDFIEVDGVYDRGGRRDNRIEADKVIDRVLHHRRRHPNLSIGLVTLSQPQQIAIEDRIFERRAAEPELNGLQYDDRLAGFFVKNLENVQGDERDIMILSVGYGPDEHGNLYMNFGPMNQQGGERRLNVAVTRARCRFEVVCSFDPDSITDGTGARAHLRDYLKYARSRGVPVPRVDPLVGPGGSQRDPESPFEEDVLSSLRGLGHTVEPQVGAAGYRIDIGVRHPRRPGAYLLGVECDGASYHSSKVARDRDRLRQEVLERLGWTIYRVWSTSWFNNRQAEERRLGDFIRGLLDDHGPDVATTGPETSPDGSPDAAQDVAQRPEVEIELQAADFTQPPDWTVAYEKPQQLVISPIASQFEFTNTNARPHICEEIVSFLSNYPYHVHRDDVRIIVQNAWGIGRGGKQICQAFTRAVNRSINAGDIADTDGFLHLPGEERISVVRVPRCPSSPSRGVQHVPPGELQLAILKLLHDASGAFKYDELRTEWARLFGWARIGPNIRGDFDKAIDRLVTARRIERRGGSVHLVG